MRDPVLEGGKNELGKQLENNLKGSEIRVSSAKSFILVNS